MKRSTLTSICSISRLTAIAPIIQEIRRILMAIRIRLSNDLSSFDPKSKTLIL
jgi:hypothetical protein